MSATPLAASPAAVVPLPQPAAIALRGTTVPRSAAMIVAIAATYLLTNDWLAAFALLVLLVGWRWLAPARGAPALAVAFTYQWLQAASGLFYFDVTGRTPLAMAEPLWRDEVIVAMVAILALALGLRTGTRWLSDRRTGTMRDSALTPRQLLAIYVVTTVVAYLFIELTISIDAFAGLYQGAVFFAYARLAVLYLVFRRLLQPRVRVALFALLVLFEIVIGITGYFASFREVIVVAALALLEIFDARRLSHWLVSVGLGVAMLFTGLVWTGIKAEYRSAYDADAGLSASRTQKFELVQQLAGRWVGQGGEAVAATTDAAIDRLWQVYYPAMVLRRVPDSVPHTNGAFLWNAIVHVLTPRFFFEDKAALLSDSDKVRRYAGANVAGVEQNTSIAFGYVAESYVDFGVPFMYLPIFMFGLAAGLLYSWSWRLFIHQDVATGALSIIFWLGLYLFERSWDRTLGVALTTALFVGGAAFVFDRILVQLDEMPGQGTRARPVSS